MKYIDKRGPECKWVCHIIYLYFQSSNSVILLYSWGLVVVHRTVNHIVVLSNLSDSYSHGCALCNRIQLVPLNKALCHTCFTCGQGCKWWSCQPKLTSSAISDVNLSYTFISELYSSLQHWWCFAFRYVLIDTPGQIEVFTWSASGNIITEALVSLAWQRATLER